jgi:subtilisin family serine protease
MAPECQIVSLKVFRQVDGVWQTSSAAVMAALEYLRTEVNLVPGAQRVHGVNLSLGCEWDPAHYAAGQSPLCQLINQMVDTGLIVVVSAGNSGQTQDPNSAVSKLALLGSITEPAHADGCITVGSTHRDAPHVFGISWTSSKGPTLDGRIKPDIVAPGEWITSAAAGSARSKAGLSPDPKVAAYVEDSGTSMAAPHVSGVIAGFLSARPEFIGRARLVKELVSSTAIDLGRERYAQGAGLIDAMGMLSNR